MFSLAFGIGTKSAAGHWLEVYYPQPLLAPAAALLQIISAVLGTGAGNRCVEPDQAQLQALAQALTPVDRDLSELCATLANSVKPVVLTLLDRDEPPGSVPEVYLKLHLLSHRLTRPHGLNLDGMFGILPNVAWTSEGAIALSELPAAILKARLAGKSLEVNSVDKFPKMSDYVVPTGVRIADTARVRLGAYLGEGTTIMHEGFVNFNAGSAGPAMVEGRISAGVFVAAHSDLGGGCSILGTLSGGNKTLISVGEHCLIGANAGLGIPLGDRCIIESGLYLTAGSKVSVCDKNGQEIKVCKAMALSGMSDLLFRRNSQSGRIECLSRNREIELNTELHSNN